MAQHGAPPPLFDLRPLNGLRALCAAAVVCFHCWVIWSGLIPYEVKAQLTRQHPYVSFASVACTAVDVFLVLTGMLAAYQLVPVLESADSCWAAVRSYWRRRAARVLPPYLAANALMVWALPSGDSMPTPEAQLARNFCFGNCPKGAWLNLALLTHQRWPESCGLHLWSLTLQLWFYAAFPLALLALRPRAAGFRPRLAAALAAACAGGTVWRLWRAWTTPLLHLPLGDTGRVPAELQAYLAILDAAYFPAGTRLCQLAMGAGLGLLLQTHQAASWLRRRRAAVSAAALGLAAAWMYLHLHWCPNSVPSEALWSPTATRLYAALGYYGSLFTSALICAFLLALILRSDPLHSRIASALSSPAFLPAASLSYCLYLVHEMARLWGILYLLPAGWLSSLIAAAPVQGLLLLTAFTLVCAYVAAWLLYVTVERPLAALL